MTASTIRRHGDAAIADSRLDETRDEQISSHVKEFRVRRQGKRRIRYALKGEDTSAGTLAENLWSVRSDVLSDASRRFIDELTKLVHELALVDPAESEGPSSSTSSRQFRDFQAVRTSVFKREQVLTTGLLRVPGGSRTVPDGKKTSPWADAVGPLYRLNSFAAALGWTEDQVRQAVDDLRVFGLYAGPDGPLFPAGQLSADGKVLPAVSRILERFSDADVDEFTLAAWLNTPKTSLDGLSVWESLRAEPEGSDDVWNLVDEFVRRASL